MLHQVPACLLAAYAPTALISEIVLQRLEKGLYRLQMVQMDFLSLTMRYIWVFFLLSYFYELNYRKIYIRKNCLN